MTAGEVRKLLNIWLITWFIITIIIAGPVAEILGYNGVWGGSAMDFSIPIPLASGMYHWASLVFIGPTLAVALISKPFIRLLFGITMFNVFIVFLVLDSDIDFYVYPGFRPDSVFHWMKRAIDFDQDKLYFFVMQDSLLAFLWNIVAPGIGSDDVLEERGKSIRIAKIVTIIMCSVILTGLIALHWIVVPDPFVYEIKYARNEASEYAHEYHVYTDNELTNSRLRADAKEWASQFDRSNAKGKARTRIYFYNDPVPAAAEDKSQSHVIYCYTKYRKGRERRSIHRSLNVERACR